MKRYKRLMSVIIESNASVSNTKIRKIIDKIVNDFQLEIRENTVAILSTYLIVKEGKNLNDIINAIKTELSQNKDEYK